MNILLATDGSSFAIHAAKLLNRLRCSEPIKVTILTAVYLPMNHETISVQTWYPRWRDDERNRLNQHHQELRSLLSDIDGELHTLQVDGLAPAHCILEEAEKANVDLIVMGARGHSTIGRILLGSVSDNVATHASCSVLIVRGDEETWATDEPIRMTIAYDHSAASQQAVEDVKQFQWASDASAQLLSVVRDTNVYVAGYFGTEYVAEIEESYEEQADVALAHAEKQLPALSHVIQHADAQVIRGEHAGDSILKQAEDNQSNLIVIGNSGHGVLSELILGSTSKYVLRQAPCSVWIARAPETKTKSTDRQSDSACAV